MPHIPCDLIFSEILHRLPSKSLMRFKCVSKSFEAEISSRRFTDRYLDHRCLSSANDLLIVSQKPPCATLCDLDSAAPPTARPTATFTWDVRYLQSVGSANGLICFTGYNNTVDVHLPQSRCFSVLNPTTRQCTDLPSPFNPSTPPGIYVFVFDPLKLDYKIVAVFEKIIMGKKEITTTRTTSVYSFNTNSCTTIVTDMPGDLIDTSRYGDGIVINDTLVHWPFSEGDRVQNLVRNTKIGCFDVVKNRWVDDVRLPQSFYTQKSLLFQIGVIDDLLSSTFWSLSGHHRIDMWVMKEYGVQDSWVKLFSIPFPFSHPSIIESIICREAILFQVHEKPYFKVCWHDWNTREVIEGIFPSPGERQFLVCRTRSHAELPGATKLFEDQHKFCGIMESGDSNCC